MRLLAGQEQVDKTTALGLSVEAENFLENKILEILAKAKGKDASDPSDAERPVEEEKEEDKTAMVLPGYKQRSR